MSVEENKAMFRRTYEELLNRGDLDVADELVAPEFKVHEAPPGRDRGPEAMRGLATDAANGLPRSTLRDRGVGRRKGHGCRPLDYERHSRRAVDGHATDGALGEAGPACTSCASRTERPWNTGGCATTWG